MALEPMKVSAFGDIIKTIKGKNVGGLRANLTIYEGGMEVSVALGPCDP